MKLDRQRIVTYLIEELGLPEGETDDEMQLFSTGTLDSFGLVNLIRWIEEQEGIKIRATEVSLDNFDTIARIVAFVGVRAA